MLGGCAAREKEGGGCDNTLGERKYGCYYLDNEPVNKGYVSFYGWLTSRARIRGGADKWNKNELIMGNAREKAGPDGGRKRA